MHYLAARLNEKGCVLVWGWRCSLQLSHNVNIFTREREKYKLFGVEPLPIFQGHWGTK
jgi:hypothetical protein